MQLTKVVETPKASTSATKTRLPLVMAKRIDPYGHVR